MSIIKSFLFKIFNKEFSFTNNNLSRLLNFNSDTQLTSLSEIINDYEKYLLFESEGKVKKDYRKKSGILSKIVLYLADRGLFCW